jgi:hypothetical protein
MTCAKCRPTANGIVAPAFDQQFCDCDPFVDSTKAGIFRNHSCWACNDGAKPCRQGHPHRCEYPHARND